jgi:hypothetical protein
MIVDFKRSTHTHIQQTHIYPNFKQLYVYNFYFNVIKDY